MNLMNSIDAIATNAIVALYNSIHFDVANLLPAQIDRAINGSAAASAVRLILEQFALAASLVFATILVVVGIKKRALRNAKPIDIPPATLVVADAPRDSVLSGRWNEILGYLDSTRENDWKTAVMEADKLVDGALQRAGFSGDTFGDRLIGVMPGRLATLDGLWWAHRVRNRVAHELDYFLRYTEARQAMSYYEAALNELQLV